MPSYAFVRAPLYCPSCRHTVADEVWVQWGYCRGRAPYPESVYAIGDAVRWMACGGRVHAWSYLVVDGEGRGGNFGQSDVLDVLIRDRGQQWLREACPSCGAVWGGGVARVSGGRFTDAWLAPRDQ